MTYNFDISISDPSIEINAAAYYPYFAKLKALGLKRWRLVVPFNLICTSLRPGPLQTNGRAMITATATGSIFVGNPQTNGSQVIQATAIGNCKVTGIAPSAQGRDWHHVDNIINDIRLHVGCDITLVVGQGFPSGSDSPAGINNDFKTFCIEAAQRYGPGGPGIRTDGQYASLAGWGVTQWEIWNEENNAGFWTFAVSAKQYTALLKAGHDGIKTVLPGGASIVIFGGMQHIPFEGAQWTSGYWTVDEFSFLQQCYAAAVSMGTTLGTMFDTMATHMYPAGDPASPPVTTSPPNIISLLNIPAININAQPVITAFATGSVKINANAPQNGDLVIAAKAAGTISVNPYEPSGPIPNLWQDNFRQLIGIRSLMVLKGDGAKKIKITEMNYSVYDVGLTAQLQQAYMQQAFDLINMHLPGVVDEIHIYNALDTTNNSATSDTSGFGLLDYKGNPRPLYNWLLTLPSSPTPVNIGGSLGVTVTATGTAFVGGGADNHGGEGGVVIASIKGAVAITKSISGGSLKLGGSLNVAAHATGSAKINITAHSDGNLLVKVNAHGGMRIAKASSAITLVDAIAKGDMVITINHQEVLVITP